MPAIDVEDYVLELDDDEKVLQGFSMHQVRMNLYAWLQGRLRRGLKKGTAHFHYVQRAGGKVRRFKKGRVFYYTFTTTYGPFIDCDGTARAGHLFVSIAPEPGLPL